MTEVQRITVASLRVEILEFVHQQFLISSLVTALLLVLFIAAQFERCRLSVLVIPVLIGSGLWALARTDLLMHRAAAYISAVEGTLGWESFKVHLALSRTLPLYDLMSLGLWLVLLLWAMVRAGTLLDAARLTAFRAIALIYVLSGIASIIVAATM